MDGIKYKSTIDGMQQSAYTNNFKMGLLLGSMIPYYGLVASSHITQVYSFV